MTERILGETGSKRRWRFRFLFLPILLGGAFALFMAGGALAVHDTGNFELDGNATNDAGALGDDWDNVCHEVTITKDTTNAIPDQCASASDTTNTTAVSWTAELNTSASIFTGGGSKDPIDVSSWAWKDAGGLPDKDNLLHSFAARYVVDPDSTPPTLCPAGTATHCDILYFGSDRFDNSGDAQQGFWFFQNKVTLGNIKTGGGFNFNGVHRTGDILVISDFSNGGTVSTISVYKWNPAVSGNLQLLLSSDTAKCSSVGPGDAACGIVNESLALTTSPWTFLDKSGNTNFAQGEFYEGGINLSTLGLSNECFSSVASESRSSTSTTATLKDFVLGQLTNCQATLATQVKNAADVATSSVNPGVPVHDVATVTGSSPSQTPTGDVTFFMCSFAAGTTDACDDSGDAAHHGTQVGSAVTLSGSGAVATADSADVNSAASPLGTGRYCFRAEWPGDTNYVGALKEFSTATECFNVVQSGTTTETHPQSGGINITSPVAVGTSVTDHAVITGATGFGDVTGTVNFFICNPTETSGAAGSERCETGGTAAGSPSATPVAASTPPQSTADSNPVIANTVGVWCFRAEYVSNTANYTGSSDSSHTECFTVRDSASVGTAQDWLPNDTATVTATGGTALNGTLTFELHESNDCSGPAVAGQTYTRTLTDATTLADRTKTTSNSTYFVTADKTVSWKVTFAPAAGSFVDGPAQSSCEITALDLTQ